MIIDDTIHIVQSTHLAMMDDGLDSGHLVPALHCSA